jgi:hypothetical protein
MPKTTNKIWTLEEDNLLREKFPFLLNEEIMSLFNRPFWSIVSRASFLKIKKIKRKSNRTFQLNVNYFNKIDSKEKAYWYGFLWADGSVYKNNFELCLQARDKHVIEKFKKDIESTHSIKKHYKYNTYRFLFASKEFCNKLNLLNITERKSYSSLLPKIEDKYFANFLMGLFDGDGCFCEPTFQIVCNPTFASWLQEKIFKLFNINTRTYKTDSFAVRVVIFKQKDVNKIMNIMYSNNEFFLERKLHKYLKSKAAKLNFGFSTFDGQKTVFNDGQDL